MRVVPAEILPRLCSGYCPAAHCRHDANLGVTANLSLQHLIAAHDFTVDEHVDVRPHVPLLSQHAIAQPGVDTPEFLQGIADRRRGAIQLDVRAAAREFCQLAGDLKSNHEPNSVIVAERQVRSPRLNN